MPTLGAQSERFGRILVTGSEGFIGQHVMRRLHRMGLNPAEVRNRHDCDLCRYQAVKSRLQQIDPGIIVHLAASPDVGKDPLSSHMGFHNTVNCTLNLLYAVPPKRECVFIYTGSYKQYGASPIPFKEHYAPNPVNSYGRAKQVAENIVRMRESERFRPVYMRIGSVYGPGQPEDSFLSVAVDAVLEEDFAELKVSNLTWDPIYVSDVVNAICRCIATPAIWGQTVNVSGGVAHTPLQTVREIMLLTSADLSLAQYEVDNDGYSPSLGDIELANQVLDWRPEVELTTGLKFIINHHLERRER